MNGLEDHFVPGFSKKGSSRSLSLSLLDVSWSILEIQKGGEMALGDVGFIPLRPRDGR
jgi:hypothetical protein